MIEYQRMGRNKDTTINQTYISGGSFRNKFDKIVDDKTVSRVLYNKAKEMLYHRSGTKYEDMYWIDAETGEIIASILDAETEEEIIYNSLLLKRLHRHNKIIAMHTHPNSMPPSVPDFNFVYKHGYDLGIIICHDGKIFIYTAEEEIRESLFDLMIAEYYDEHYNESVENEQRFEFKAQLSVLNRIKQSYSIDFREVE